MQASDPAPFALGRADVRRTPRLAIERSERLPHNAWLAEVVGPQIAVLCGDGVEAFDDGFFEGCWDGPFEDPAFERAANVFGSGLKRLDEVVTLVAASHTLEALFLHETSSRIVASNSLAFLLEHEHLELPAEAPVCRRLATVVLGLEDYERVLFEHAGGRVWRIAAALVEISGTRLNVRPRAFDRNFVDFRDYRGYLLDTLLAVFENGASPDRRRPLARVCTTVSSGYDSAACAALAATLGCREALTLRSARGGHGDSGRPVAEVLGLEVLEFDRARERAKNDPVYDEAEFLASGMGGEDAWFGAFEPALRGTILCSGFHGDKVWEREVTPNPVLTRGDLSGSSLTEFRLRIGFAHVPVPFIGAPRHHEIHRIGLSKEMEPWRLGTSYDRPVPRRIAEEAGVPRNLFGQKKKAASMLIFQDICHLSQLTRQSLEEFERSRSMATARRAQWLWAARFLVGRGLGKALAAAELLGMHPSRQRIEKIVLGDDWRVFEHSSPLAGELAFRWALEKIRLRYRR